MLGGRPGGQVGGMTVIEAIGNVTVGALQQLGEAQQFGNLLQRRQLEMAIVVLVQIEVVAPLKMVPEITAELLDRFNDQLPSIVEGRGRWQLRNKFALSGSPGSSSAAAVTPGASSAVRLTPRGPSGPRQQHFF